MVGHEEERHLQCFDDVGPFGEIYNYLNLLDNISVLYLKGRLDRAVFPVIYREHVLQAARAIRQGSESERKDYTGILKVAEQLKGLGEE